jgi:hypothetical protein
LDKGSAYAANWFSAVKLGYQAPYPVRAPTYHEVPQDLTTDVGIAENHYITFLSLSLWRLEIEATYYRQALTCLSTYIGAMHPMLSVSLSDTRRIRICSVTPH